MQIQKLEDELMKLGASIDVLLAENKRFRKALEWISQIGAMSGPINGIGKACRFKATAALSKNSNGTLV